MYVLKNLFVVVSIVMLLSGCGSLEGLVQDIQSTDATTEIAAVSTLTGDLIKSPWDNIAQISLGYLFAILRRKYKVSKGAK